MLSPRVAMPVLAAGDQGRGEAIFENLRFNPSSPREIKDITISESTAKAGIIGVAPLTAAPDNHREA